jgi:hypothetical protein
VLSDLDSELIKQVESERLHFIESEAEEIHGPLYSVPNPGLNQEYLPEGSYINGTDELSLEPIPDSPPRMMQP